MKRSALPLSGMRSSAPRCPAVSEGNRRYGEPIRDTGRREHEGAGRPSIDCGPRARARYMAALATFPDAPRARISRCRVTRQLPLRTNREGGAGMRIIGLHIHRAFAEAVAWDDGKLKRLGRVDMRRPLLEAFAKRLSKNDVVVVEATGNASSVAAVIAPHVKKVVIANPKQVRIIAHAKIKTDTIDASVLAQLYASGFLPEVWIPDEPTQALRRQVTRRNQIVRQRSRLKNIIQSILHSHLIPSCPHADLCGASGRAWLFHQVLPEDERLAVERHLREFDRLGDDLKVIERDLARSALADESIKQPMTIPGIHMIVALAIKAAVGDVERFARPQKLVVIRPWYRDGGLLRRPSSGPV